jgi:hypothetical protein
MPTEELPTKAEETTAPATAPKPADLSAEIAMTVAKQPGDRVRVSKVWGDHYRCNWVAPTARLAGDRSEGTMLESFHIRHSRFLKVTRAEGGKLNIQDMTASN